MKHYRTYGLCAILLFTTLSNVCCQTVEKNQKAINTIAFDKNAITIIDISKSAPKNHNKVDEFDSLCQTWTLSQNDILEIIKYSKPISMHDFMYLYNVLPCEVKGKLKVGDKEYNYVINAGSFMKLSSNDKTYYYGCTAEECEKYFLSTGGDPNRI